MGFAGKAALLCDFSQVPAALLESPESNPPGEKQEEGREGVRVCPPHPGQERGAELRSHAFAFLHPTALILTILLTPTGLLKGPRALSFACLKLYLICLGFTAIPNP